jgi:hypothetical protein
VEDASVTKRINQPSKEVTTVSKTRVRKEFQVKVSSGWDRC